MLKTYKPDNNIKLSKNFMSNEFKCNCSVGHVFFVDDRLVLCCQVLRNLVESSVFFTNAYRCPEHNINVGGVITSYHTQGMAVDIPLPSDSTFRKFHIEMARAIFPFVLVYEDKNFMHCDIIERV